MPGPTPAQGAVPPADEMPQEDRLVENQFGSYDLGQMLEEYKDFDIFSRQNTKALVNAVAGEMDHNVDASGIAINHKALDMIHYIRSVVLEKTVEEIGRTIAHGKSDPADPPATCNGFHVTKALRALQKTPLDTIQ